MTISVQGGRRSPKTSPAIFSNDVITTKETYKGKELVVIEEDEDPDPPFVHEGPFRLMDLPAELRVYIYSFLMPYNMVIKHEMAAYPRSRNNGGEPGWCIEAEPKKKENEPDAEPPAREVKHKLVYLSRSNVGITTYTGPTHATCNLCVSHQLFLVNKAISNEALSVLYGCNTYHFTISGHSHTPSMQSPLIFGPFGTPLRLPLLRNLRSIRISVLLDVQDHWAVKRQRARLDYFVSILQQHSSDATKNSLLHDLTINFLHGPTLPLQSRPLPRYPHTDPAPFPLPPLEQEEIEKFMFTLESLVALTHIKLVSVTGVPDWFAKCLERCIEGKTEVKETDWPMVKIKRGKTTWCRKNKTVWVSGRKWWQPVYDWREVAEREEVEVSGGGFERFWMAED